MMRFRLAKLPSDSGDCFFVFKFPENVSVRISFHENFGELLLFIGRLILLLTMVQQHVNFADQQCFGIFKFCKIKERKKQLNTDTFELSQTICLFIKLSVESHRLIWSKQIKIHLDFKYSETLFIRQTQFG